MAKKEKERPDKNDKIGRCGDLPDADIPSPDHLDDGDMGILNPAPFEDAGYESGWPLYERED